MVLVREAVKDMAKKFRELNVVHKRIHRGCLRIALVFPSTYQASLSSLGLNLLYYLLNSHEEVYAERFTYDTGTRSIETGTPLKDFDLIMVSASYELTYPYMLKLLDESGIPLFAEYRRKEKKYPLLVVGGPAVSGNPEPLAEFSDIIVIGDAEPTIPVLISKVLEYRDNYKMLLDDLASRKGFYIPTLGKHEVYRVWVEDLDRAFHPVKQIQNPDIEPVYGKGFMVEISRGCSRMCRFCLEGHVMLPKRDRSFGIVKNLVKEGFKANNVNRVIFYALSFFDHPEADRILEYVVDELKGEASIPSLRPDTLSDDRLELIARAGQKTLTIAPETLSPKIARILGKGFRDTYIEELSIKALNKNFKLKFYFIIGVPGETIEDIIEIPRLIERIVEKTKLTRSEAIRLSVNPLIPKPQTPLQGVPLEEPKNIMKKLKLIESKLPRPRAMLDYYSPKWAVIQAVIAQADRDIAKTLALWSKTDIGLGSWRRVLRETGYRIDHVFKYREPPYPWSHIKYSYPEKTLR